MDNEILHQILEVQESALSDNQYMQLHKAYIQPEENLRNLMNTLPQEQRKIIEDYLTAAVPLHHRLMYLAICYGQSKASPGTGSCHRR